MKEKTKQSVQRNYQKELEALIQRHAGGEKPTLLLHSCCGPCSSYVLEYLDPYFDVTVFYYNPNIFPKQEYEQRIQEQREVIRRVNPNIRLVVAPYLPKVFHDAVDEVAHLGEGSERCFRCYALRLRESAMLAKEYGTEYFTTSLSISPYKNAAKLMEIGEALAAEYGVTYLPSDFKKKGGYQRSVMLSKAWGLYRQDYCGCVYSMKEARARQQQNKE